MLEIGFTLLNKRNKFIISISIRYVAKDVKKSKMHIALNINNCKIKSWYINVNKI